MFEPIFHSFPFLILSVLLSGAAAWWCAPTRNGRKPWGWILLRWSTLLLLGWILARPSSFRMETETFPGSVFVLADTSRSMEIQDAEEGPAPAVHGTSDASAPSPFGPKDRFSAMKEALARSSKELGTMAQNVQTEVFAWDQTLHPLELGTDGRIAFPERASGDGSALGFSLLEILQRSSGRKVLGVVLLSDGAQRALPPQDALPQTAAQRFQQLGIPLYSVTFGSDRQRSQTQDAAVEDFLTAQRVFVETEVTVSGRIRLEGLEGREIPVELLVENASGKMETAARTTIQADSGNATLPVQLSWVPKEPGEVKVTLRVPPQNGEVSDANNQMDAYVSVVKSGLRVLYLEGAFRPETGFLRRSLDAAEEIQLDLVRLQRRNALGTGRDPVLQKLLREEYAVILLGDVNAACFHPEDLALLEEKIMQGTGLLTLGGLENYAEGGYAETPFAKILPVVLDPAGNSNGKFQQNAHWNQPIQMKLTPAGKLHLALALDSDAAFSEQLWSRLPRLDGANRFTEWKPGAVILASDRTPEGQEIPLLLEHSYGRGRVMAMAADSTWRWHLGGFEEAHRRFWRQVVFWLANKESTLDGTVSLILPQRRFPQGQKISFHVSARLSNGKTVPIPAQNSPEESWTAFIESTDGTQIPIPLTPEKNVMAGAISTPLPPGEFMLHAAVTHQGQKIGESKCRFQVFHHDLEMDRAQAEPQLMASLALSTGGKAVKPDELGTLWKQLAENREELKIERRIEMPLWDRWWWLALLITALTLEWILRKRAGAV